MPGVITEVNSTGWLSKATDRGTGGRHSPVPSFYHPELDVLRFGAFFLVFLAHLDFDLRTPFWIAHPLLSDLWLGISRAGVSGVCLFFALSSYLITELLLRERASTGTVHLQNFYLRRVLRIWPLYFFFLLLLRPYAAHFLPVEEFPRRYLAAYLLLAGNWECARHGWPLSVAAPLWSISVEEQFYLVWPMTVARLRQYLPTVALGMLVAANVFRYVTWMYSRHDLAMWCDTLTRLDPFALGAMMAYLLHERPVRLSGANRALLMLLGALLLLFNGRFGEHEGQRALSFYPIESAACMLLLFSVWLPGGSWRPKLPGRLFIYLGRISYGLYVYHLLMLRLLAARHIVGVRGALGALLLTVGVSSVSYFVLEEPFLQLKQRFTFVSSRL